VQLIKVRREFVKVRVHDALILEINYDDVSRLIESNTSFRHLSWESYYYYAYNALRVRKNEKLPAYDRTGMHEVNENMLMRGSNVRFSYTSKLRRRVAS
jgi:hypothetical protein